MGVSGGPRSVLRLRLTDEQPCLCAEPRGPGSLSRKEEEEEEETVAGLRVFFFSLWRSPEYM